MTNDQNLTWAARCTPAHSALSLFRSGCPFHHTTARSDYPHALDTIVIERASKALLLDSGAARPLSRGPSAHGLVPWGKPAPTFPSTHGRHRNSVAISPRHRKEQPVLVSCGYFEK